MRTACQMQELRDTRNSHKSAPDADLRHAFAVFAGIHVYGSSKHTVHRTCQLMSACMCLHTNTHTHDKHVCKHICLPMYRIQLHILLTWDVQSNILSPLCPTPICGAFFVSVCSHERCGSFGAFREDSASFLIRSVLLEQSWASICV